MGNRFGKKQKQKNEEKQYVNTNNNSNNKTTLRATKKKKKKGNWFRKLDKLTLDDFELLQVAGKGSFGKVYKVEKKDTKEIYAMKVLKKQQLVARKQVTHTKTERKVLAEIDNPFIVSLRFAFQTSEKLYMIFDFFTGGELFYHLKEEQRFSENRAKFYAAEILLAIECLHDKDIIYRDLKPENVLLAADGHIRLTDFGLSKESVNEDNLTHTFCGTPEYLAPEVIHAVGYGKPVDWWSFGTLLFEMLTGLPPFYDENLHNMYERIANGKIEFPKHMSGTAKHLILKLLDKNPDKRLGSKGGSNEIKRHPFFAGYDWDKVYQKKIKPPFLPKEKKVYIDDEFKEEQPKETPVQKSGLALNFPQFTYDGEPNGMLGD